MSQDKLMESLADYGYPLLLPKEHHPEKVLENLLEQQDVRFLEGFPVVLLKAFQEKAVLDWEKKEWKPDLLDEKKRERLFHLLTLSVSLFKRYKREEECYVRALQLLQKFPRGQKFSSADFDKLENSNDVSLGMTDFSYERFRNAFETYGVFAPRDPKTEEKRKSMEQDLLLSELFTPLQKQLLKKRLRREALTKTEREYFSRVLKKRLRALASNELHQMAAQLLMD